MLGSKRTWLSGPQCCQLLRSNIQIDNHLLKPIDAFIQWGRSPVTHRHPKESLEQLAGHVSPFILSKLKNSFCSMQWLGHLHDSIITYSMHCRDKSKVWTSFKSGAVIRPFSLGEAEVHHWKAQQPVRIYEITHFRGTGSTSLLLPLYLCQPGLCILLHNSKAR